jgi:hypothetical protein
MRKRRACPRRVASRLSLALATVIAKMASGLFGSDDEQLAQATRWFAMLIGGVIMVRVAEPGPQREAVLGAVLDAAIGRQR